MKKIIATVFLSATLLFGSLIDEGYNDTDIQVLKSFDVEESFLHDPNFIQMKSSILNYRIDHLLKKYDEGFMFISTLKQMINEAGIPQEFLYLAMAESEFSPRAYSVKKASGLWQFIPGTAKLYGLKIDSYVDERRDPIKSTEAAIKYLSYLHDKFGKWYLAAIAYNCGDGRLSRAIKQAGTDNLSILLNTKKKYLPRESRNYIRKILSIAIAFNDVDFLSNTDMAHFLNRGAGKPITTVKVKGGTHLGYIAQSAGVELGELKNYNRHLRYDFTPPYASDYDIYIPYTNLSTFKENFDPAKNPKNYFLVHSVKRGDTLSAIGDKYNISWRIIKDANKLRSNMLSLNQNLIIPVYNNREKEQSDHYMVKNGDTIYSISKMFRVAPSEIMEINDLKTTLIKPGDRIVIPN